MASVAAVVHTPACGMKYATDHGTFSSHTANGMTDLMTSLVMVFILLFVAFITQTSSEAQSALQEHKHDVQTALKDHLSRLGLSLDADPRDPLTLMIVVPENLLTFEFHGVLGIFCRLTRMFGGLCQALFLFLATVNVVFKGNEAVMGNLRLQLLASANKCNNDKCVKEIFEMHALHYFD